MADDITLTVRVRDMTRGQFDDVRRRMNGMDGDIRRLGQTSDATGARFQRMSRDVQGVSGRLGHLQRSGNLARSEMDFMRRSMGLLSRDLRQAARNGELTADEFRALQGELERTRLGFDRLDNEIRRNDAVAQRAHRAEVARQQARQRMGQMQAAAMRMQAAAQRDAEQRLLRMGRMQAAALRMDQQRDEVRRRSALQVQQLEMNQGRGLGDLADDMARLQRRGNLTQRELDVLNRRLLVLGRNADDAARAGRTTDRHYRSLAGTFARLRSDLDSASMSLGDVDQKTVKAAGGSRFAGGMFAHLRQKAIGAAVVLGVTLLPTIGALAPMLAGVGAVAGVAALAFSGLDKPTKFLSKSQKEFLVALKPVTKELGNLRRSAQDAVLPKLSQNFDDVARMVKALNPVIKIAGDSFGDLVGKIARGVSSKDFLGPFTENVKMGTQWLEEFAKSFGTFSIKFFEFGTKSQPALDAWQNLLGGFLDRGLPNMFKELEVGVGGSSEWLNALADTINNSLLPGLGKLAAEFMKAFGPFLGELLMAGGSAFTLFVDLLSVGFRILSPFAATLTDAFRAMSEVFDITMSVAGSLAKALGGALLQTLMEVAGVDMSKTSGSFTQFSDYVKANATQIRLGLVMVGIAIIDMVNIGIQMLPILIAMFKTLSDMILVSVDIMIASLVQMGSKIPGPLGDMFTKMGENWEGMKGKWNESLDAMVTKSSEFAAAAEPHLSRAKVVLQTEQAEAELQYIKEQLKDPELTEEREAKLNVDKEAAEEKLARAEARLTSFDLRKADPDVDANVAPYFDKLRRAEGAKISKKTGQLDANPNPFWNAVRGLAGRVLGTSYINVQRRFVPGSADSVMAQRFGASGGLASRLPMKRFAEGGSAAGDVLEGPGTKTSDSLIARLSRGEFVMQARAVDKYGPAFMRAVNEGRLTLPGFKKGGMSDSMKTARNELRDSFGISHFGSMAGYKRDPFEKSLAAPADIGALTSALNGVRGDLKRAFTGRTETRILKTLDSAGRSLIKYQRKLTDVNAALDKAKTKLTDLKNSSTQLRETVSKGITGEANITKGASGEDSRVTINTLLSNMTASAANSKQFASMLGQLKARGLSGELISQIGEAGIAGGGMETAAAVLGGGSSEIKRLNDLQKQISSAAGSAGKTTADAMYAAGIKAAEGLVKGLTAQQDKIEAAMMRIAKSMEAAIKKALKIKSPSQVMQDVGHNTAEGFALGVIKNKKADAAWTSLLPRPRNAPGGTYQAGGGSGSGGPMVVQIQIGEKNVGEILIDPLRKSISHRGGNVQAVLGR